MVNSRHWNLLNDVVGGGAPQWLPPLPPAQALGLCLHPTVAPLGLSPPSVLGALEHLGDWTKEGLDGAALMDTQQFLWYRLPDEPGDRQAAAEGRPWSRIDG